jgi:hypothetical protein
MPWQCLYLSPDPHGHRSLREPVRVHRRLWSVPGLVESAHLTQECVGLVAVDGFAFGLCMGFGLGGVLTLKELDKSRWQARVVAVLLGATYALAMLFVVPAVGLLSGGLVPFTALGLADYHTEHKKEEYRRRRIGRCSDRTPGTVQHHGGGSSRTPNYSPLISGSFLRISVSLSTRSR